MTAHRFSATNKARMSAEFKGNPKDAWDRCKALGLELGRNPTVILMYVQRMGWVPKGTKRVLTPEDRREILRRHGEGEQHTAIAESMSLSRETIRRVLRLAGVPPGRKAHDWTYGEFQSERCTRCAMRKDWPGAKLPCKGVLT